MNISYIIGERLRSYRRQKGWSQELLAEHADLHATYIGQLERGEKTPPSKQSRRWRRRWTSHCLSSLKIFPCQRLNQISPLSAMGWSCGNHRRTRKCCLISCVLS